MERTARALLINILKRNPSHPLLGKIQVYIERLMQSRLEATDEPSRKRALPNEPIDGLDSAKRARLDALTPPIMQIPPLPPGPLSFSQLFTLTQDASLSSFDVKQLPADLVVKITVPLLAQVNPTLLTQAVDVSILLGTSIGATINAKSRPFEIVMTPSPRNKTKNDNKPQQQRLETTTMITSPSISPWMWQITHQMWQV